MLQLYLNQIHVLRDFIERKVLSLILAEKPSVARDITRAMNIKENVMDILKTKSMLSHGHWVI